MDAFKEDLDESLSNRNVCEYTLFQNIFVHNLDKQVRIKKKKKKCLDSTKIVS